MTKAKYDLKQEARQLLRMAKRQDIANALANLYEQHKAELAAQAAAQAELPNEELKRLALANEEANIAYRQADLA